MIGLVTLIGAPGCGEKPRPRKPAVSQNEGGATNSSGMPLPPLPPATVRTVGGIELTPLVPAGPEGEALISAAQELSRDRKAAAKLIAAGAGARPVVLALLGSENIEEVLGALEAYDAKGDPVGLREEAGKALEGLVRLLGHEVREIRDRAWQVAPKIADGDGLVALLDKATADDARVGLVRLLAGWDGPTIREALAKVIRGSDMKLAEEATYAMVARGRDGEASRVTLAAELLADEGRRELGLRLATQLSEASMKPHAKPLSDAIESVLKQKSSVSVPLISAAIRASKTLPRGEHLPLLLQLAADEMTDVRRIAIETLGEVAAPDDEVMATVGKGLDDPEGSVRIAAVRTLAALAIRSPKQREAIAVKLLPKLAESHQGVRLAAVATLAQPEFATLSEGPLGARLDVEKDGARDALFVALASSKHRALAALVVKELDDPDARPSAHLALTTASGVDRPANPAAWQEWLATLGPAPVEK